MAVLCVEALICLTDDAEPPPLASEPAQIDINEIDRKQGKSDDGPRRYGDRWVFFKLHVEV